MEEVLTLLLPVLVTAVALIATAALFRVMSWFGDVIRGFFED